MASGLFGSFTIPTSQRTCQLDCRVWSHPASPGVHRYTQLPFVLVLGKNRTVAPLVPEEQGRGSRLQIAQSQGRHPDAGDRSHLLVVGPCQSVLCRTVLLSLLRVSACPRQGRESSHSCAIGQPLKSRCHWPVLLVVGGHRGRLCACPEVGFMHRAADSSAIARHKAYLKSHPWKTASILIGRLRPGSAHPVFRS